eukprot:jgi/Mesen1/10201/ME000766S09564
MSWVLTGGNAQATRERYVGTTSALACYVRQGDGTGGSGRTQLCLFVYSATTAPQMFQPDLALAELDPEMARIIDSERQRQFRGLELIASENFTSRAVMEAVGSCLTNKKLWSQIRGQTFEWGEGLDLPHGGHLSHGFMTPKRRVSATSVYFESMPYRLDEATGLVDYDALQASATLFRPKLLIAGASAYPRDFDYARMRQIADSVGAFLLADMAHISGLVAAGVVQSPFEHCDIVTTTTHKSLRGPRGGMIFMRRAPVLGAELEPAINNAVFPGLQGIDGARAEKVMDLASITLNKNSVPGDKSAVVPGGVRIGSPALTTRGFQEHDFVQVADFIDEAVKIAIAAKKSAPGPKVKDFLEYVESASCQEAGAIAELRQRVEAMATRFPIPGVGTESLHG